MEHAVRALSTCPGRSFRTPRKNVRSPATKPFARYSGSTLSLNAGDGAPAPSTALISEAKSELRVGHGVVQRLDAEAVPRQEQPPAG